ncbi:MAG: DegT/DnrJ/EryC1/StrS family aminotransferase [Bacteroidia bacterium]
MVDLKGQYLKIKEQVDAGIDEVINNTQFIKGPQIKVFEENLAIYNNAKHVIACANGTDALQVAMMALNLKPGDEIIVPVFTYIATAEVIGLLGLTPIMVDVDPNTFCIDPNKIENVITPKTKAIVPVHLFGQCADMDVIMQIAEKYNLVVIEDTAQAIGAVFENKNGLKKFAGTIGHIGTTSFFPSKNLGCYGDGGALFTNDDELAKTIRMICNHGQSVQYVHDIIGVNSRLDSIQAAVLNAKLPHLKEYENARNQAATWYDELLTSNPKIKIPYRDSRSTHVFHQYTIQILDGNRDEIRKKLSEIGIPSMVYYPIPLHLQKAFVTNKYKEGDFPVAEKLCKSVLSLPIHTEMTKEMVEYICNNLLKVL